MKKAVIFDLDGVLVSTDDLHYEAWLQIARREGIYFDRKINDRLRGVSRHESLEIILENADKSYSEQEKLELTECKNRIYRQALNQLSKSDILAGVESTLSQLKSRGIKLAIGSSSKNAQLILKKIGIGTYFDAVISGNEIKKTKPDPQVFTMAAANLGLPEFDCVVVEDAQAGIQAAKAAGMKAVGVGDNDKLNQADVVVNDLNSPDIIETLLY